MNILNAVDKENIAIVGAGIWGLCTALALGSKGHRVTVYERDIPPPEGGAEEAFFNWKRRGAAQFR
ncbi:MAG: FAD-dependent oxidoreductase, partial [Gammaproteobacteria bacterium]|nr:FAD-dependent oxidoreductase [Gammaproteobacteria bacterium]